MKKIIALALGAVASVAFAVPAATAAPAHPPHTLSITAKPKPHHYTVAQRNAIGSAKEYLATQGFSKAGLVQQLSSKYGGGFKHKDAVFAVGHIKVNWNKQAVRSAKEYLDTMPFSRAALIQQLTSKYGGQFTHAQAVYGVNHVGL